MAEHEQSRWLHPDEAWGFENVMKPVKMIHPVYSLQANLLVNKITL